MNEQEKYDWMVCVLCMTFNHAPYIEDAMNGFTMQKTSFPYVCCIVDDASTDGEPKVIKKYLEEHFDLNDKAIVRNEETDDYYLTFVRHKENHNCYFAVLFLKYNHYHKKTKKPYFAKWYNNAKYIATCEGDDFWIDPRKLQKQFDVLENDETISMCHHNFYELKDGIKQIKERIVPERQDLLSIARYNPTQTLTLFFRNMQPIIPPEIKGRTVYSQFWALRLAEIGDLYYIEEPMAVYRRNPNSIFGLQPPSQVFEMSTTGLDSTIFWYKKCQRRDVVNALKKKGRNKCIRYFCHFLKEFDFKYMFKVVNKFSNYL